MFVSLQSNEIHNIPPVFSSRCIIGRKFGIRNEECGIKWFVILSGAKDLIKGVFNA